MSNKTLIAPEELEKMLQSCAADFRATTSTLTENIKSRAIANAVIEAQSAPQAGLSERLAEFLSAHQLKIVSAPLAAACVLLLSLRIISSEPVSQPITVTPAVPAQQASLQDEGVDDDLNAAYSGMNGELLAYNDADAAEDSVSAIEPAYEALTISSSDFQQLEDNDDDTDDDNEA